jgi:hypothetical protein
MHVFRSIPMMRKEKAKVHGSLGLGLGLGLGKEAKITVC